jgi:hypothetical protein
MSVKFVGAKTSADFADGRCVKTTPGCQDVFPRSVAGKGRTPPDIHFTHECFQCNPSLNVAASLAEASGLMLSEMIAEAETAQKPG